MTSFRRQRGIAILTAVAVAALVASIATFMAFRENLWLRQVENQHDLAQAHLVAQAALDLTRLSLQLDGRSSTTDNALEEWNTPITNLPVEQGSAGGKISDVQGLFNINSLVTNGTQVNQTNVEIFQRLLVMVGLSADLSSAVVDWIDEDVNVTNPGGAEDPYYLSLEPPRRAANRPMFDISELAQVKGFDAEAVKRLSPYVVALPQSTKINVNFAPPEVLMAVLPTLDKTTAQMVAAHARAQPFNSIDDMRKIVPAKVADQMQSDYLDVVTHYFYSDVDAHFGRVTVSYRALVERLSNSAPPRVVWLRRR